MCFLTTTDNNPNINVKTEATLKTTNWICFIFTNSLFDLNRLLSSLMIIFSYQVPSVIDQEIDFH